jgi:predicted Zn-dependent protease
MTRKTNRLRTVLTGTLIASAALMATVPFNMGGCSTGNIDVMTLGGAVIKGGKALSIDNRQERAIGESVSLAATNRYGVTRNDRLATYVVLVGQTLASRTMRADQPWVFGVLDTDKVNAFSGPGGYVWITRGAIDQMQDESELAGVLGHEIAHVVKQHGLDMARKSGFFDAVKEGAGSVQAAAQFSQATDTITDGILDKGFSQPQEFEADEAGVKYVIAAGYDPNGFLHFLQRMNAAQKSGGSFFSTHPGMDDRVKKVANQVSSSGAGGTGATLKDRFQSYTSKTAVGSIDLAR